MKKKLVIQELYKSLHILRTAKNVSQEEEGIIREKIIELEREIEEILMAEFNDIEVEEYVEEIKKNAEKAREKIKTNGVEMVLDIASYVDEALTYAKKIKEFI